MGGDTEVYRLAWEAVGCNISYLPYPSLAGSAAPRDVLDATIADRPETEVPKTDDEDSLFMGHAALHRSHAGELLGLHWSWGKKLMHSSIPVMSDMFAAPLGGYVHRVKVDVLMPAHEDRRSPDTKDFVYTMRLLEC